MDIKKRLKNFIFSFKPCTFSAWCFRYVCHKNFYLTVINKLIIYSASAGSGKTYTLSKEYIKLLLKNSDYHRRILAVTFTNKATEEMKSRIIRELYRMSKCEDSNYICVLAKETGLLETELPDVAQRVLSHLLHDYTHFSIVTIDSFFQKVIRSFAREMGLYTGYNVELDQASILDESVDLLLEDIAKNDFLKDWLVDWAERKIEEGRSWNFKSDILKLGNEIFSEELQNIEPELLKETTDKESLERFRIRLYRLIEDYKDDLQKMGASAMSVIHRYHLTVDDFAQKEKGVAGYFQKLSKRQVPVPNAYVSKAVADISGWYNKSSPRKNDIELAYDDGLNEILQRSVAYQKARMQHVVSAELILKQISVLGILCDLMQYVNKYTRDQNLFLLSEASGFLKTIIANADAPFIYERIGSFYHHFMIDEFQDTSAIQWDNFRPLVVNSLASGYSDWIVGDVKQSIYRWRNTDWKILSEQVKYDIGIQNTVEENLSYNWRSTPEIVHFNNAFFHAAVKQLRLAFVRDEEDTVGIDSLYALTASMMEAYKDCYQHLPERKTYEEGYVHMSIVSATDDNDETWRDKVLKELPQRIEQLQDLGYALSDIAILVRENKEAQMIADMLLSYSQEHPSAIYRYDVLSNESLLIGNSPAVKWLVAALRFIIEPGDDINKVYLQYEYDTYLKNTDKHQQSLTDMAEIWLHHWRSLPVYELVDQLIQEYNLYHHALQAPFIQAFQDIILQYTRRAATDVRSFLHWWDEEKDKKYVTMPDNQDAIRLLTIHKAKGLEFEAVLIPFCDWSLAKPGKMLWCRPQESPFDDMKLLPLRFESALRDTIFVKEYLQEKMMSYIDNLNLLYVAFTRARKALFVYTPQPKKDVFTSVRDLIYHVYHQPMMDVDDLSAVSEPYIDLNDYWQSDMGCFELGMLAAKEEILKESHAMPASYLTETTSRSWRDVPHITRNSAYFTVGETYRIQIDRGRLLHDIFRQIITIDDLERHFNTLIVEGKLSESERMYMEQMVHQMLEHPIAKRWFAPDVQVKTEAEILLPDGSIVRPDRVVFNKNEVQVIDYKFGAWESTQYQKQVLHYMTHLQDMGYTSVKGFLWYVTQNKIEEVGIV